MEREVGPRRRDVGVCLDLGGESEATWGGGWMAGSMELKGS